jgi:predicted site-specific integrase-resolvase
MGLFEENKLYSSKEVKTIMSICRSTLEKYCRQGLQYTVLPGSKTRRFRGKDLNNYFETVREGV